MQPFEVSFPTDLISDLRERIKRTRWPDLPFDRGWERGMDGPGRTQALGSISAFRRCQVSASPIPRGSRGWTEAGLRSDSTP
jgi:hypothetical protein